MKVLAIACLLVGAFLQNDRQTPSGVHAFSTPIRRHQSVNPYVNSPLFQGQPPQQQQRQGILHAALKRDIFKWDGISQFRKNVAQRMRRPILIAYTIAMLWFGTSMACTTPAYASSPAAVAPPTTSIVRNAPSTSLDTIVDSYVNKYMFNDDEYDPVESAYREAVDDKVTGTYRKSFSDTVSTAIGSEGLRKNAEPVNVKDKVGDLVFTGFKTSVDQIGLRLGVSMETAAKIVVGSILAIISSTVLFGGMTAGGISKRNMAKTMKKRYGDTYSVDATIKPPSADDDDDEEDDEDDDDEDDEDDDEDETDAKDSKK